MFSLFKLALVLALVGAVSAFRMTSRVAGAFSSARTRQAIRLQAVEDPFDSSEIQTGSSTELKERQRMLQLEAEKAAAAAREAVEREAAEREAAQRRMTSSPVSSAVPAVPKQVVPAPVGMGEAMSTGGQAFDVGLLIAFPVMIGTLALFFVFPLIRDQIAANLPPVPMM